MISTVTVDPESWQSMRATPSHAHALQLLAGSIKSFQRKLAAHIMFRVGEPRTLDHPMVLNETDYQVLLAQPVGTCYLAPVLTVGCSSIGHVQHTATTARQHSSTIHTPPATANKWQVKNNGAIRRQHALYSRIGLAT
jgi:hypothetical protein